jgi:hypothetical protein
VWIRWGSRGRTDHSLGVWLLFFLPFNSRFRAFGARPASPSTWPLSGGHSMRPSGPNISPIQPFPRTHKHPNRRLPLCLAKKKKKNRAAVRFKLSVARHRCSYSLIHYYSQRCSYTHRCSIQSYDLPT